MKYFIAFIAALFLTACATNPAVQTTVQPSNWKFESSKSYEPANPGAGTSAKYVSTQGWVDVYSYDWERSNWITGVSDPQFSSEFNGTIQAVRHFEGVGRYKNVIATEPKDVVIANLLFRSVSFKYETSGKLVNSAIYLTALNGKLLKYRISLFETSKVDLATNLDS